jgi:hypothetical protein
MSRVEEHVHLLRDRGRRHAEYERPTAVHPRIAEALAGKRRWHSFPSGWEASRVDRLGFEVVRHFDREREQVIRNVFRVDVDEILQCGQCERGECERGGGIDDGAAVSWPIATSPTSAA